MRRLAQKALLVLLGCATGLLACELGLRALGLRGEQARVRSVFDARYGEVPRDSWIWSFQIDASKHRAVELRGRTIALRKPPGERRVLFLGDSATAGAFLPVDAAFPERFGALVAARDPHVTVINAGVWGMTTIDEYHLLADKLLPLSPDIVVLCVFMANDLNWNLGHRERRAADDRWDALRNHSALGSALWNAWIGVRGSAVLPRRYAPLPLRVVDERGLHMLSYPEGELAMYLRPHSPLVARALEVFESVLQSLLALGKQHGFAVRVLLLPSPSRVLGRLAVLHYPHLLAELADAGIRISPADIDVDQPTRDVLEICGRLDLVCMDPTPRLQRLGLRAFVPSDEHPSRLGHEALAQELLAH